MTSVPFLHTRPGRSAEPTCGDIEQRCAQRLVNPRGRPTRGCGSSSPGPQRALINRALAQTSGNVTKAARLLGINRMKIYRRLSSGQEEDSD